VLTRFDRYFALEYTFFLVFPRWIVVQNCIPFTLFSGLSPVACMVRPCSTISFFVERIADSAAGDGNNVSLAVVSAVF
jgi:hypothetical protein